MQFLGFCNLKLFLNKSLPKKDVNPKELSSTKKLKIHDKCIRLNHERYLGFVAGAVFTSSFFKPHPNSTP